MTCKTYYKTKSKKQRRKWWDSLTSEQQESYIKKKRANPKEQLSRFDPKYPWMTTGVNSTNRAEWLAMIHKKNPWLKVG